jgi:uncharacterized lipoprotein NlpE involved in copper resistance
MKKAILISLLFIFSLFGCESYEELDVTVKRINIGDDVFMIIQNNEDFDLEDVELSIDYSYYLKVDRIEKNGDGKVFAVVSFKNSAGERYKTTDYPTLGSVMVVIDGKKYKKEGGFVEK